VAIKIVGVFGKFFSSLGKMRVGPEKFFDSQNGTLTEGRGRSAKKMFK
jgi:hypothetical protein